MTSILVQFINYLDEMFIFIPINPSPKNIIFPGLECQEEETGNKRKTERKGMKRNK